ncbi:GSCOCT00010533001.3-RA-CDS [Cotesia congregata]|uniref:Gustatory receptor n=1 Tax=Cotesia congregata TaxID=51543 RepID=A0A8J2H8B7_COTCN|nr:GSCOCT00010533001.3-RA-CDS [Cotesia congregata]CAG5084397.1 gustatory receptor 53 [Cotesia congregata]
MTMRNLSSVSKRIFMVLQYIIFKLIGLSPWTIDVTELFNNNRRMINYNSDFLKYSIIGVVYNLLLIISLGSFHIYVLFYSNEVGFYEMFIDSVLTSRVHLVMLNLDIIITLVIWFNYIVRQKKIIDVVERLIKLDKKLQKYDFILNDCKKNCRTYLIFFINFVLCLFLLIIQLKKVNWSINALIEFIPIVVMSWSMMQFTLMINLIKKRFEKVNKLLLSLGNLVETEEELLTIDDVFSLKEPAPKKIIVGSIVHDVDEINDMHSELCDLWSEVLNFYGIPVLLTIYQFCGKCINTSYLVWIISHIYRIYGSAIFSNLFIIFGLFVMINTVTKTIIDESKKTARNIHVLQNKCIMDEKNLEKLCDFSWSLLHRQLECCVCNFINIDGTLLLTLLDMVVEYTIVLIGFRMS